MLQYFLAVVKEENITRASEILHVTQPTLSRQLAQLEEELGTQLFVRGKPITLTDAGILFRHRAEEILELLNKTKKDFDDQKNLSGVISIGCGALNSVSKTLPFIIEKFKKNYPKVEFEIYIDNSTNIKERLDKGLLNFGFLLEPINVEKYDYIRIPHKEQWGVLMPASSPLAVKEYITKEELLKLPLITTNRLILQNEITNWLGDDFSKLNIFLTCNMASGMTSIVNAGLANALLIEDSAKFLDPEHLVFRPLYPSLYMTSVLAWKKFQSSVGAAGKFLEYFKEGL